MNMISATPHGRGANGDGASESAGNGTARERPGVEDRSLQIVWSLDRSSDIGRALLAATRRLREAEIDSPELDASVLLCSVLGVNKAWLYAHPTRSLTEAEIAQYEELVRRRMRHEPVAYLVGYKPFYGLDITVDNRVLIPRPETEMLVERALAHAQMLAAEGQRPVIADVGTGSGAIAVALAVNAPEATVYATDVSAACIEVSEKNIWRYGVGEQVHLVPGSLLDNVPEPVDIVVANLPYVATPDLATLAPQVRNYEPILALDGGPDGCDVIRQLLASLATTAGLARLKPGAVIFLEIGADEGALVRAAVHDLLPRHLLPQAACSVLVDYAGLDRVVVITT